MATATATVQTFGQSMCMKMDIYGKYWQSLSPALSLSVEKPLNVKQNQKKTETEMHCNKIIYIFKEKRIPTEEQKEKE